MAAIWQTTFSDAFSTTKSISIELPLKYVRKGPTYNNPAFVQILACRRTGDVSEPMIAKFGGATMRLSASMS